ncbi:MAG: hypothetical protein RR585_15770 [Coprobacillus sp.]
MENQFIGYEYKDIIVEKSLEAIFIDSFTYFGWQLETSRPSLSTHQSVELKFKRDRKIRNKAELTRLQRQFEAFVHEISLLETSKKTKAMIVAFTLGICGTVLIAASTFSYLGGLYLAMILFAAPGFIGWILPYFCYMKIYEKKVKEINPLIEKKYDEIYDICEKANQLLGKG